MLSNSNIIFFTIIKHFFDCMYEIKKKFYALIKFYFCKKEETYFTSFLTDLKY